MKETGVVARLISRDLAEVAFQRTEACEKCRLCHDLPEHMVGIEAHNGIGAKVGEQVEIEIPSGEVVRGSIVVFLFPIFFLGGGYLIGSAVFGGSEAAGIGAGLLAFFFSFFFIQWYDKNIQQRDALRARIIKVYAPR